MLVACRSALPARARGFPLLFRGVSAICWGEAGVVPAGCFFYTIHTSCTPGYQRSMPDHTCCTHGGTLPDVVLRHAHGIYLCAGRARGREVPVDQFWPV